MKRATKIIMVIILIPVVAAGAIAAYLLFALPDVGPAPQLTIEQTPERIERGKYLVNSVAACMVCHTRRDFDFFGGPLDSTVFGAGGEKFGKSMGFPGNLYTTNITPYAMHSYTDGELYRAITAGVKKNGNAIFPLMPYERYGKMNNEDIYAMIAYLRTIKSIKKDVPRSSLDFPLNFLVNTMPSKGNPGIKPDTANTVEYGKYLVNIASCIQCHSKEDKGDLIPGTEFGGGQKFAMRYGAVYSANITPDSATGIGSWTKEDFIERFKKYSNADWYQTKLGPKDFNSTMPWLTYSTMTGNDLAAIYDYLRTIKPINNKVEKWK